MSSSEKVMTVPFKFVPRFPELTEDKEWWWQSENPFCFHADMKTCRHVYYVLAEQNFAVLSGNAYPLVQ